MNSSVGTRPMVLLPGSGEPLPFVGRLRASGAVTGGMIEVIEYSGPAAPPPHVHKDHDEVFVILNGSFRFVLGSIETHAPHGTIVLVPRGFSHGFTMEPGSTALLLVLPAGLEGYFSELGRGLAEGRSGEEIRASLAGRYDSYPDPPAQV
jgi:mannose-6-phosphate isomerase-like protein (cupin superfamily)